ncbi:DUF2726 domain-containing protein [Methylobacterium sp. SyP6R]|uniref:DUF2726 domain-containing protein n=1 Tax=Methylobacterium sp. SyP6R TaxID=2718876 RepID=UPI001F1DE299|nr:DUF2726 domain-containing protein [Methylobacterium sp. SyP6R]MCF4125739.1 DUF2726 domain-containing protein [Methylobacterium sp. SyP6R]
MMRIVNKYEEIAHGEIKSAADRWGLSVYPKVRVADVISLDDVGATGELRRFGLQSHFDFVICRQNWDPVYAIEFDGHLHTTPTQISRDSKKDELCKRDNFPILRINSRYLNKNFGPMSLVAWIIDVYELQTEFERLQVDGQIPPDEPFDPFFMMSIDAAEERFPYWLSAKPRIYIRNLYKKGKIVVPSSSGFIGYDTNDVMWGMEYIQLTKENGLYVRSAMRPQHFPINLGDLLDEILSVQLSREVLQWDKNQAGALPMSKIYLIADKLKSNINVSRSHSCGQIK